MSDEQIKKSTYKIMFLLLLILAITLATINKGNHKDYVAETSQIEQSVEFVTAVESTVYRNKTRSMEEITTSEEETTTAVETTTEIITTAASKYSDSEIEYLCRCIESEAGNQSTYGKQLVVSVILNRVDSTEFPNTITDVINSPGQFEVVSNGYINQVTVSDDTRQAVEAELNNRSNYEILYFRTGHYHTFGTPVLQYEDHYFSK